MRAALLDSNVSRFGRFALVGGAGLLVDMGVLWFLLHATPLGPLGARVGSMTVALCCTWLLNRNLTFGASSRSLAHEGARYGGVGVTTSLINYLTYASALALAPWLPPLAALAIGSAVAMILSFLGYSMLVFDR